MPLLRQLRLKGKSPHRDGGSVLTFSLGSQDLAFRVTDDEAKLFEDTVIERPVKFTGGGPVETVHVTPVKDYQLSIAAVEPSEPPAKPSATKPKPAATPQPSASSSQGESHGK